MKEHIVTNFEKAKAWFPEVTINQMPITVRHTEKTGGGYTVDILSAGVVVASR